MDLASLTLGDFTNRGLNLLAHVFGDVDARVVLANRSVHPLTVALESRTVVLHPERAGLYDLALGARLLQHRGLRRKGPDDPRRKDAWLTLKAQRQLAPRTQVDLQQAFPGIGRLKGLFRPGRSLQDLRLVDRTIEWEPLSSFLASRESAQGDPHGRRAPMLRSPGLLHTPDLEINGAEEDFAWLINALEKGEVPLMHLDALEELPYIKVSVRQCVGERHPLIEEWEEQLACAENKELVENLMNCHRRKSEVRQQRLHGGRHTRAGVNLDMSRLVDAVMARRSGVEPRLFRKKGSLIEPVFDPREHLTVITFDMNDLRNLDWHDGRAAVLRFLACLLTTHRRLEVDCVVQCTADRLITLSEGRHVCLHCHTRLKSIDEPFDEAFFARFGELIHRPPVFPGVKACFHPLGIADIVQAFDDALEQQEHSYRTIVWWARHGMPGEFPQFQAPDFLMRAAEHVDREMDGLERRTAGTLDTLFSFLPDSLQQFGEPGRYLQGIQIP